MREKLARWMYGRYGEDAFGRFLMGVYLVLIGINLFVNEDELSFIAMVIAIYMLYRVLSKQRDKRRRENEWYLNWSKPFYLHFRVFKLQMKDKEHRYYLCPKCKQICRVVRRNKKGVVTCPRCYHQFERRS